MIAQENPVSNATGGAANCIEQIARDGILQWDSIIHFCTRSAKVRQSEQRLICCANNWIGCIGTSVFVRGPKSTADWELRVRGAPFRSPVRSRSARARASLVTAPHSLFTRWLASTQAKVPGTNERVHHELCLFGHRPDHQLWEERRRGLLQNTRLRRVFVGELKNNYFA